MHQNILYVTYKVESRGDLQGYISLDQETAKYHFFTDQEELFDLN